VLTVTKFMLKAHLLFICF